jgi:hypothetical protein
VEVWPTIDLPNDPTDRVLHLICGPCGRSVVLVGHARTADPQNPTQAWLCPHSVCRRLNTSDLPEMGIDRALTPDAFDVATR